MRFLQRLQDVLSNWELQKALDLSDEIHTAEENGYETSEKEELAWEKLTEKVEKSKQR